VDLHIDIPDKETIMQMMEDDENPEIKKNLD